MIISPAAACKRVQISGQRGDQRLSFAGLHLGDLALVQDDSTDQLHIEMAHAERTSARLANQCEGGNERRFERIGNPILVIRLARIGITETLFYFLLELLGLRRDVRIRQPRVIGGQLIDRSYLGRQALDVAFVLCPDKPRDDSVHYFFNSHTFPVGCSRPVPRCSQSKNLTADKPFARGDTVRAGVSDAAGQSLTARLMLNSAERQLYLVAGSGAKQRLLQRLPAWVFRPASSAELT